MVNETALTATPRLPRGSRAEGRWPVGRQAPVL